MPYKVLSKTELDSFVSRLVEDNVVYAPQEKEAGRYAYSRLYQPEKLAIQGYIPTILPPKKYLFPQQEELLKFELKEGSGFEVEPVIQAQDQILLGVRPCDINGIRLLDRVFMDDVLDEHYAVRRSHTAIIGFDCEEHCDEYCFCESVGALSVDKGGYDLFLTDMGDYYMVSIGSNRGAELLARYAKVREANEDLVNDYLRHQTVKLLKFPRRFRESISLVPLLLIGNYESEYWEELGKKCLACGQCNIVCPTCNCFDVLDVMHLSLSSGTRQRMWDGCMLEDFAKVASGENFRANRANRIRHRIYRKFKYQMQKHGESYCVGCGRCARACLVDINPYEVINELFQRSSQEAKA